MNKKRYLLEQVDRDLARKSVGKRDYISPDGIRVAPAVKLLAKLV